MKSGRVDKHWHNNCLSIMCHTALGLKGCAEEAPKAR